jgi:hypothetical protein
MGIVSGEVAQQLYALARTHGRPPEEIANALLAGSLLRFPLAPDLARLLDAAAQEMGLPPQELLAHLLRRAALPPAPSRFPMDLSAGRPLRTLGQGCLASALLPVTLLAALALCLACCWMATIAATLAGRVVAP